MWYSLWSGTWDTQAAAAATCSRLLTFCLSTRTDRLMSHYTGYSPDSQFYCSFTIVTVMRAAVILEHSLLSMISQFNISFIRRKLFPCSVITLCG